MQSSKRSRIVLSEETGLQARSEGYNNSDAEIGMFVPLCRKENTWGRYKRKIKAHSHGPSTAFIFIFNFYKIMY